MNDRICSIEGCENTYRIKRGMCSAHYQRWSRHGDPLAGGPTPKPRGERMCAVDDCGLPAHAKGYCNAHYRRLRETGDVDAGRALMPMPSPSTTTAQRLDANSKRVESGCLEWRGFRNRHGYGEARFGGKPRQMVHRVAYELINGPIPDGLIVRHKCDNPPCIAPEHLEAGTMQDNTNDMIARGRAPWQKKRSA